MKKIIAALTFLIGSVFYFKAIYWIVEEMTQTISQANFGTLIAMFAYVVLVVPLLLILSKYVTDNL